MPENESCRNCNTEMRFIRKEIVAGTKYKILKCEKCKQQVARAETQK